MLRELLSVVRVRRARRGQDARPGLTSVVAAGCLGREQRAARRRSLHRLPMQDSAEVKVGGWPSMTLWPCLGPSPSSRPAKKNSLVMLHTLASRDKDGRNPSTTAFIPVKEALKTKKIIMHRLSFAIIAMQNSCHMHSKTFLRNVVNSRSEMLGVAKFRERYGCCRML